MPGLPRSQMLRQLFIGEHERARTFQHDDAAILLRKIRLRCRESIALDIAQHLRRVSGRLRQDAASESNSSSLAAFERANSVHRHRRLSAFAQLAMPDNIARDQSSCPSPGPIATTSARSNNGANRSALSTARQINSGRLAVIAATFSGRVATVTRPDPTRNAASPDNLAAPAIPSPPAMTSTCPCCPL